MIKLNCTGYDVSVLKTLEMMLDQMDIEYLVEKDILHVLGTPLENDIVERVVKLTGLDLIVE